MKDKNLIIKICICVSLLGCNENKIMYDPNTDDALKIYQLYIENPDAPELNEEALNIRGYKALEKGEYVIAKELFEFNTLLHPESYNAFDSYAEGLLVNGDTINAIRNFKKSLELNTNNDNAYLQLQIIEEQDKLKGLSLPEQTFESFWIFFENNYSHFELKNINWKDRYNRTRSLINSSTPDSTLFKLMEKMLDGFEDIHVSLEGGEDYYYESNKSSEIVTELRTAKKLLNNKQGLNITSRFFQMIDSTLSKNVSTTIETIGHLNETLPWLTYSTNENIGYLRTISFMPLENAEEQLEMLDEVFSNYDNLDGLILDLRLNNGGYDLVAFRLMGKLTKKRFVSHKKQNRRGNYNEFDELTPVYIEPIGKHQFTGKVIILTNDRTVSAGEIVALGLSQLDNVRVIGNRSHGSLSDVLYKELPNGWIASLSNERYFDNKLGNNYEGVGIPVDFEIKNTADDIIKMKDTVVIKAIELIKDWK